MIELLSSGNVPVFVVLGIFCIGLGYRFMAKGDNAAYKRIAISCMTLAVILLSTIVTFPIVVGSLDPSSVDKLGDIVSQLRFLSLWIAILLGAIAKDTFTLNKPQ